ncbi:MAG: HEAT repeat domain-containing protein, partial [Planctomycetes bacterium]|nr:HEAT repeat domain-containing protein [Planctomycetota bacterium]
MRNLLLVLLPLAAAAHLERAHARCEGSEPCQAEASGSGVAAQDAPEARRVLKLSGGGWVRDRTRQVSGSWMAWGVGGWSPVGGEVLWAREEAELLGELRLLERSLESRPVGGPAHQEALRWLCRSGLLSEAEEHATRALEARPDDARLLLTLRETELLTPTAPRSVQDQRDLLLAGARGSALERERAASSLALLESREGFSALLASVLGSPSARERALGHHLARRLSQAPPWRQVVRASLLDPVEEVRLEASRGLGARAEPRLLGPLLQALDSKRSLLRRNAAQALGAFGHPAAVEPLISA